MFSQLFKNAETILILWATQERAVGQIPPGGWISDAANSESWTGLRRGVSQGAGMEGFLTRAIACSIHRISVSV